MFRKGVRGGVNAKFAKMCAEDMFTKDFSNKFSNN